MQLRTVRALRGPNVWARVPVLEARLELGEQAALPERSGRLPG